MDEQPKILVVDDEQAIRDSCQQALAKIGNQVSVAENGTKGLEMLSTEPFDLVIVDLKMPGLNGMELLKKTKEIDPEIVVVVITGYATIESAVEAMKAGAYDFIPKPFTPDTLRMIAGRALEKRKLALENILLRAELRDKMGEAVVVGKSPQMQNVQKLVQQAAPSDSSVLISGETGTGKELIARTIHSQSRRKDKPFILVDCTGLEEKLFECELFGQTKGALAPAAETKYGQLEVANGGTVFFDEAANLSAGILTKLLGVLQKKEFMRVGSSQPIKIDVRIIAGTSKDLLKSVQARTFREDLFYLLSVVAISLPPLRERKEDIPLLAAHFLTKYNRKREKSVSGISDEAMKILTRYDWPGNVRELENVIERAVVLTKGGTIEPDDLWYYDLSST